MIRLIEEFQFGVVTRVYLVDQCGCITILASSDLGSC